MKDNTVYQAALSMPWAIEKSFLPTILAAAQHKGNLKLANEKREIAALDMKPGTQLNGSYNTSIRNGVAIIPVHGAIIPRANLFSDISALTSTDRIANDLITALESPKVKSIIFDFDSPGGAAKGINELANKIYQSRSIKPIKSYVGASADSAAYWLASATSEIVIDATADLGSIGVVLAGEDKNKEGQWKIISSNAPKKHLEPTTEEGQSDYQRIIDDFETVFIESVSRNRGVSVDTVIKNFGQGSVLVGKKAITAKMADRIGNLEDLIIEMSNNKNSRSNTVTTSSSDLDAAFDDTSESPELSNNDSWESAAEKAGIKLIGDSSDLDAAADNTLNHSESSNNESWDKSAEIAGVKLTSDGSDLDIASDDASESPEPSSNDLWDKALAKTGIKTKSLNDVDKGVKSQEQSMDVESLKLLNNIVFSASSPRIQVMLANILELGIKAGDSPDKISLDMMTLNKKYSAAGDLDKASDIAGINLQPIQG